MVHIIELYEHQKKAIKQLKNGSILCGGVGSGKSRTGLAYYFLQNGGEFEDDYIPMDDPPKDLYIITTARKRDTLEWEGELSPFLLSTNQKANLYSNKVVVDSWNNIRKYIDVTDAFFIFDEQRVVGHGAWVKAFLKITKNNQWILLSATPGDTWMDYIPVFIANGFYKNRTEFLRRHVVFNRFAKYPKVDRYVECGRLIKLRKNILVNMRYSKNTISHNEDVYVDYDKDIYKDVVTNRWDPYKEEPIRDISGLCYLLRRISNSDKSRIDKVKSIIKENPRCIVFYNFNYELDILRQIGKELKITTAEWNGQKHEPVPDDSQWLYLVQYAAGSEAWNCTTTNVIIFYSQNYSYKTMIQAAGRIDRLTTPYSDLYYYHLKSKSSIDMAISKTLEKKKNFNEKDFIEWR